MPFISELYQHYLSYLQDSNAKLSSRFSFIYMSLEITMKISSSLYLFWFASDKSQVLLFAVLSLFANVASLSMLSLLEIDSDVQEVNVNIDILNVVMACQLIVQDVWLVLMIPYQFVFGFASSYIPFYVFGTIIKSAVYLGGDRSIGLFSALVVTCSFVTATFIDWLRLLENKILSRILLGMSSVLLATAGLLLYIFPEKKLSNLSLLIPYISLYGASRGLWEVANKRVLAEHFEESPERASAGFTLVSFLNSLSGALGYFSFLCFQKVVIDRIILFSAMLALVTFCVAEVCFSNSKALPLTGSKGKGGATKAATGISR